ncbi:tripartite motif-containing protein 16-like isoform X1 [Alosa sapidissima]|uniref:tripartite motif-containing protein 16-like isoform X1 n=1 Tax=Alosa sapidissima TaxID=34773 RepID=UPI001C090292|nr:tripartite motif-containing protein 16-like isoform X1 [Alosa sapidissima]
MAEAQAAPPVTARTGSGDVECDLCSEEKLKVVVSCPVCLTSFCEVHVQPRYQPALQKHKLVKATQLQEKICFQHGRLLEMFCYNDQKCICVLCTTEDHNGHNTVFATVARTEKQKLLLEKRKKFHRRIQEREIAMKKLTKAVVSYKRSAQEALEHSDRIFTELLQSIERRRSEVKELIRAQEEAAVSRAEEILKELEREIEELKRGDAEMEELSREEDDVHFLQSFQALQTSPVSKASLSITLSQHPSFDALKESLIALKRDETCQIGKILAVVRKIHIVLPLKPKTREEFMEYSCPLTLDPDTAHRSLSLSEANRKATRGEEQPYPDHPDRFDGWAQVLCVEAISACSYWEVEWTHEDNVGVDIALAYKHIDRKGVLECRFGCNKQSWRLECDPGRCSFRHNNFRTELLTLPLARMGVYVDHRVGLLSFYSVSDTMTLLHTVQTTFTEPLYPGFWVANGASIKICAE